MAAGHFSMVKWYLDCITPAGDALIVYCSEARWRGLNMAMGSVLESAGGAAPETRSAVGQYSVSATADEIRVENPRLGVGGTWQAIAPAHQSIVYESADGAVTWNCVQPAARTAVRCHERKWEGLGYAEC